MFSFRDQTSAATVNHQKEESLKIYLDVPYDEKNEAKALGARWDKDTKKWFSMEAGNTLVERWGIEARVMTHINHEDREYGGDVLRVDFLPKSCWCKKIQYAIQHCDRTRLVDHIIGRVNRTCETCQVQDTLCTYHIHGRWSYDPSTRTQKLVRLMALCEKCYETTHFGTAHYNDRKQEAVAHLKHTNQYTDTQTQEHINDAYESLSRLNQHEWNVDLSLLTENGIKCETQKQARSFLSSFQTSKPTTSKSNKKVPPVQHRAQSEMYAFRNS